MTSREYFERGRQSALQKLAHVSETRSFGETLDVAFQANATELNKQASPEDVRARFGLDAACYGLQKNAMALFANHNCSDQKAKEIALKATVERNPVKEAADHSAYRQGKKEAYDTLLEAYESRGEELPKVANDVFGLISSNIQKNASDKRDVAQRMGYEVCMNSFLEKTAAMFGQCNIETNEDQKEAFRLVLDSVAEEDDHACEEGRSLKTASPNTSVEDDEDVTKQAMEALDNAGLFDDEDLEELDELDLLD